MGPKLRHCCAVLSCFSHVQLFVTLWTVACQAPLSMRFFRQEYWSALPCPPPGDLPNPAIELWSPALQADSYCLSHQESQAKTKSKTSFEPLNPAAPKAPLLEFSATSVRKHLFYLIV